MTTTRTPSAGTVKVRCAERHVVTCSPSMLRVTHSEGVLLGYELWCEECGTHNSAIASAQHIALLLEMGVKIAERPTNRSLPLVGDDRKILSMKHLLDDAAIAALENAPAAPKLIERT